MTSVRKPSCIILRSLNIESGGEQRGTPDRKAGREIDEFYVFSRAKAIAGDRQEDEGLDELKRKGAAQCL